MSQLGNTLGNRPLIPQLDYQDYPPAVYGTMVWHRIATHEFDMNSSMKIDG